MALWAVNPIETASTEERFADFVSEYRKSYFSIDEYKFRLDSFEQNLQQIDELNASTSKATFGVNHFSDYTQTEKQRMLGVKPSSSRPQYAPLWTNKGGPYKKEKDWRQEDVVLPVRDQGNCGSCWTFSATGAIEENCAIQTDKLRIDLSEQEMVDCTTVSNGYDDCSGCDGGWMHEAIRYNSDKGGQAAEDDYPYTAKDETCKTSGFKRHCQVDAFYDLAPGSFDDL